MLISKEQDVVIMKKLEQREWAFIDDIIFYIYNNDDFIRERRVFLSYINQLVPNRFSVFHLADRTGDHLLNDPVLYIHGVENGATVEQLETINRYIEKYEDEDFGKWMMLVGRRDVYREMELIDDNDIRRTGYFNDTYANFGIKYSMQIISAYDKEFQAAIVLGRSEEDGDFTDKELYMMELINRHLSLRLYQETRWEKLEEYDVDVHIDSTIQEISEENQLTKREQEVVSKVVKEGLTNEEICSDLCITTHTLNKHLINIYRKCDVNSRAALTHKVISRRDKIPGGGYNFIA